MDIIVTGDKVVSLWPNSWWPFSTPEELEYVDDTTLKVVDANSFSNEGELVKFKLKNNVVEYVDYAGFKSKPEAIWRKEIKGEKSIRLLNRS